MSLTGNKGPVVAVISFPGSNGDSDAVHAFNESLGVRAALVDYRETSLDDYAALVLPGGFSYGDYLRSGAIAQFTPSMAAVRRFADRGGPVLGICNGFQVLTEAHLLPGALLRNATLKFHCHWSHIKFEQVETAWTSNLAVGETLRLPVAHGDGSYFADAETLNRLEQTGRVVARYVNPLGERTDEANVNGSVNSIAAIANDRGNVVGLMPHPERATETLTGGNDGLKFLQSVLHLLSVPA